MSEIMKEKTNEAYRHVIEKELKESFGENFTANDVLKYFFGDYNNEYRSHSRYTLHRYSKPEQSAVQRLNILWVWPLYAVLVAPIKWVITGRSGVKAESKAGKILSWLLGSY